MTCCTSSDVNPEKAKEKGAWSRILMSPFCNISDPLVLSDMGLAIRKHICLAVSNRSSNNSRSFESYLKSQNKRNIRQIVSYAQRYHSVLETGDASPLTILQSPAMRLHAMESLTSLSKYLGCYDRWQEIRRCYPTPLDIWR